ncbi:phosphatase and actin regulator 2 isoform X1 [Ornithorhynchus anatinus]|uniref:phosphatase and actin regulator 2 isoform X1 n=1 Tax=Ornithorhynchus anatinus TaxID=9258 RepID=UPI0019D43239|nr:phosphatase and actin regulator 2 isoform X1 [Ornithorhynchus anatinus]
MGQTSVSTLAEQPPAVDGLDKASIANSDGPTTGSQTPPFKRKGKLSTIGKIFKPWKWRKKKTSDKFRETSAVLERKISTRQSREELIRRGVLKELPDQDGDVTVNFENSNGHMISIGEETIQEENVVKSEEGNDSVSAKATSLEEKAEDKKGEPMLGSSPRGYLEVIGRSYLWTLRENPENCSETSTVPVPAPPPPKPKPKPKPKKTTAPPKGATAVGSHKGDEAPAVKKNAKTPSKQPPVPPPKPTSRNVNREAASSSHLKKTTVSKSASSPSTSSSSSSRPKAAKEPASSKTGIVGTTRGKKKTGKQSATRTPTDGAASGIANTSGDHLDIKEEKLKLEQTLPTAEEQNSDDQQSQPVVPPPPIAPPPPPPPPTLPLSRTNQCSLSLDTPVVTINSGGGPPSSGLDSTHPLWTEEPANITTVPSDSGLDVSRERVKCLTTKEELVKETPCLVIPVLMGETFSTSRAEGHRESQTNDSDSDGPILYTDDEDDDDEDDTSGESTLASKIRRRDTLAIKLGNRPSKKELEDKNILQRTSEEERQEIRQQIGTKLVRRLSQRPTTEELEQRNILKQKNEEEEQEAKMELKRRLSRKLSLRPTVAELQARRILRFNEYVEVSDSPDYDRRADKPWARLTPADKAAIRKELNEFKSTEMEVHEESRQFTRFHRP